MCRALPGQTQNLGVYYGCWEALGEAGWNRICLHFKIFIQVVMVTIAEMDCWVAGGEAGRSARHSLQVTGQDVMEAQARVLLVQMEKTRWSWHISRSRVNWWALAETARKIKNEL